MTGTRLSLRIAGVILLIAAAGYLVWYLTRSQPLEVELTTVSRGLVEATVVNTRAGTIKACRRSKLSPQAGGQIIRMEIREGDRVKQGQVLLELWNVDLQAQYDLAKQQLATAESRQQESCILADNAQREYIRTQQLVEKGFVSAQRADDVVGLDARHRNHRPTQGGNDLVYGLDLGTQIVRHIRTVPFVFGIDVVPESTALGVENACCVVCLVILKQPT